MDVAKYGKEVGIRIDSLAFKPALKEMPRAAVAFVEVTGIGAVQQLQELGDVAKVTLHKNVVVVIHEAPGIESYL